VLAAGCGGGTGGRVTNTAGFGSCKGDNVELGKNVGENQKKPLAQELWGKVKAPFKKARKVVVEKVKPPCVGPSELKAALAKAGVKAKR
jgi:hypothetical protein